MVSQLPYLEILSVTLPIICSVLSAHEKKIFWPLNIISNFINFYTYYQASLHVRCLLNVGKGLLNLYGWIQWSTAEKNSSKSTSITHSPTIAFTFGMTFLFGLGLGKLFATYTTTTLPYLDTLNLCLYFLAISLASNKKIESWFVWSIINILSFHIFLHKGLYILAIKPVLFQIFAIYGYNKWKKALQKTK